MHVLVIGGGLAGVTTAHYLQEAGCSVTLLDQRRELAADCSHANGSILHAGHARPWNSPAVAGQVLRWLGRERSPLKLRPARLPHMLGWGLSFLRYSRRDHHERVTALNTRLAVASLGLMSELAAAACEPTDGWRRGSLKLFRDRRGLAEARADAEAVAAFGVRSDVLDGAGVAALEPALASVADELAGAIHFPDDGAADARRFVQRLGEAVERHGGRLRLGERVERIEGGDDGVTGVVTERATLRADRYVVASGVDAPALVRPLGLRLPIEPVKGYSLTLPVETGADVPAVPIIDPGHQVVLTSLGNRLRMTGIAEFAGHDRSVDPRRTRAVFEQALSNLPGLRARADLASAATWACLRPVSADGAPIIGPTRIDNLFLNTAPGHLGWTLAAATGRIAADYAAGREPRLPADVDPADLLVARFGGG